jgi:hypothetical protein
MRLHIILITLVQLEQDIVSCLRSIQTHAESFHGPCPTQLLRAVTSCLRLAGSAAYERRIAAELRPQTVRTPTDCWRPPAY